MCTWKRPWREVAVTAMLTLLAAGPAVSAADNPELAEFKSAIRAQYDVKEKAFADDDPDVVVDRFYAADVYSVDNEGNAHSGREELRPLYREVVPGSEVEISSVRTHLNGDLGWDWANFYVRPDDPEAEAFSFIILFLWEKRDGQWTCVGDIYVLGELPPPTA